MILDQEQIYSDILQQSTTDAERTVALQSKESAIQKIEFERSQTQQIDSYIGKIGHFIEPAILPLGFDWRMGISLVAGIAGKEVVVSTLGVLNQSEIVDDQDVDKGLTKKLQDLRHTHPKLEGQKVFTPLSAFSFLIFILVYFPCVAVIAAIKKESGGWKYAIFMAVYTTGLAYVLALLVYQIGSLF